MRVRTVHWLAALCVVQWVAVATAADRPKHGYFDSNGVRLHYMTAGEGEPVVLVHGFAAAAYTNWVLPGVFNELAANHRVIALDNRGHGGSDKPHDPAKYGGEMVEDVRRLLDHLKIEKAHIVGYSLGGFITNRFLALYPERVISATLGGSGWGRRDDDRTVLNALAKSLDEGKGILPLMVALRPGAQPGEKAGEGAVDDEIKIKNQMMMLTNDQQALAACVRGMEQLAISREELARNTRPVLAIIGDRDPLKAKLDAMEHVLPHMRIVLVKGGDHISTFQSVEFRKTIAGFIDEHSKTPAAAVP